jgi:(1->4)-alpha-D-glucan 1-alpha-D-glucosylmutase
MLPETSPNCRANGGGAELAHEVVPLASTTHTPIATYRLQFNRTFTFADARASAGYLHALGISDCYASSYLCAVPGSMHGYDVADPTRLNPELGSDEDYWAWIDAMRAHGMGHVLDLVPNHLGIARSANPWWLDVLENGPSSRFAGVFDIDWRPLKAELTDKVLIPILGDQYGAVLERGELQVAHRDGAFEVRYFDDRLPLAPDTYPTLFGRALEEWLPQQREADAKADAAELQGLLRASRDLPPRGTRDAWRIAIRAREKEDVRRRLAALVERSRPVASLIDIVLRQVNGAGGDPRSFDRLDALLGEQSYRLAHWRVASEEVNYRRFFDVNELAAVRMEDPEVFEAVHRFVFDLIRRRGPTGLRIDHVDGLFSPGEYLERLQARCAEAAGLDPSRSFFVVVEKILAPDEELPRQWPVCGTTGYEFASVVNGLFVDRRNERALDDIYARFLHERRDRPTFADLVYRCKRLMMQETMSGDINSLGHQLNRFSERNRHFRDFTLNSLIATLKEIIACFPVYRTYVTASTPVADRDRRVIDEAVRDAKRRSPGIDAPVFDFIRRLLLRETPVRNAEESDERARFIGKFQQITGPVAAKGTEDTALYIYNRLLSLNEVGSDPRVFGLEPAAVHAWMARRQRDWPSALSATSTHDAKRGEDVRARISALSELPGAWKAAVAKWRAVNRRFRTEVDGRPAPGANEEYLLYQTLVGAWPFEDGDDALARFRPRVSAYMIKALREAKVHTSWLSPEEPYEQAVTRFVDSILDPRRGQAFLQAFLPFQARIAALGLYNSLSQLLIKMTAPGVPDFYQGTELWDLSLVDPDNRRPVDFRRRAALAATLPSGGDGPAVDELFRHRTDGRLKLFVTTRTLQIRARLREVYERGDYVPLTTAGSRQDCLFAFARRHGHVTAITCVPRLVATLTPDGAVPPLGPAIWGDTRVELPVDWRIGELCDAFTGAALAVDAGSGSPAIAAGAVFERLPVGLLLSPRCS